MYLKLLPNVINESNIDPIIQEYKDSHIQYMREDEFDGWVYLTKDVLVFDREEYIETLDKMFVLNNIILKKVVFFLMNNDVEALRKIGMSQPMIDMMVHIFNKGDYKTFDELALSYYGRYDLLLDADDGKWKVVEINSETPAWYPEAVRNHIIFNNTELKDSNYIDTNISMVWAFDNSLSGVFDRMVENVETKPNFLFTFVPACGEYFEMKKSADGTLYFDQEYDEDFICAKSMTWFFHNALNEVRESWMSVKVGNTDDIEIKDDGIYYENKKVNYLWSFYPLEWFFTDKGHEKFWDLYKNWAFEIVNNPMNLITQSKWIWAYIHNNIKNWVYMDLTDDEIQLFLDLVPEYRFEVSKEELPGFVSKPLYYREGVGIDNNEYIGTVVYQKRIKQQLITVNTFDGPVEGFLTFGLYMWENGWYVGSYTRFCDKPVTDYTAYYLPTVIEKLD